MIRTLSIRTLSAVRSGLGPACAGLVCAAAVAAGVAVLAAEASPDAPTLRTRTVVYKTTPQGKLEMHLHFPPHWAPDQKRPAIVFFFGGGWRGGTVEQFRPQAEYLARRGMVAARADYRVLSRHRTTPDKCVEDGKSAVRWLRVHAGELGIDPQRIVASGGSAGGHVAACTFTAPDLEAEAEDHSVSSKPNLLVLFNPVLNTVALSDALTERLGSAERVRQISPVHHLSEETPAAIIFFGTDDRLLEGAKDYLKEARRLKIEADLWTAEGQRHGFFNRSPWRERTLLLADRFLKCHGYLEGEPALEVPGEAPMECETSRPRPRRVFHHRALFP